LFIGGFSLLNLVGELRHAGFDANLWWIDLRPLAPWLSRSLLVMATVFLIAYGVRPSCRMWRRLATRGVVVLLLAIVGTNAVTFHTLAWRDSIAAGCPVAFSSLVLGGLLLILVGTWADPAPARGRPQTAVIIIGFVIAACVIGFPLAQMCCFGMTDYRRPADAVVVFGARVYADGSLSQALADRVRTGCSLYEEGLVHRVVLSGGPGDADVHETEGMRRMALRLGVRAEDILMDEHGLNTVATVRNTCEMFNRLSLKKTLVVSHFYHLPRIKMTYQRYGWEVYTVPAHETYRLTALPLYIMREVAALWVYYLRPLGLG